MLDIWQWGIRRNASLPEARSTDQRTQINFLAGRIEIKSADRSIYRRPPERSSNVSRNVQLPPASCRHLCRIKARDYKETIFTHGHSAFANENNDSCPPTPAGYKPQAPPDNISRRISDLYCRLKTTPLAFRLVTTTRQPLLEACAAAVRTTPS